MYRLINQSLNQAYGVVDDVDGREVLLKVEVCLGSLDEVEEFSKEVYNCFVEQFSSDFILNIFCDNNINASKNNLVDKFLQGLTKIHRGVQSDFSCMGYDGYKKYESLKYKKDLSKVLNRLEKETSRAEIERNRIIDNIIASSKDCDNKVDEIQVINKILDIDKYFTIEPIGEDISLYYSCYRSSNNIYMCKIEFFTKVFSLGTNVNKYANCLKNKLLDICMNYSNCNGYICLTNRRLEYTNNDLNYFTEGYYQKEGDGVKFLDGLEWVNVFNKDIYSKIDVSIFDVIENEGQITINVIKDDVYSLEFKSDILEFKKNIYKHIYPYMKKCLLPGKSIKYIKDIRMYWEDIFFDESDYRVKDMLVEFSRGI